MKAIVQDTYGRSDVLKLRDIDTPEVGAGGVLVRVHAAVVVLTFKGPSLETPALFSTERGPNPTVNLIAFLVLSALFSLVFFTPWRRNDAPAA